jgi:hypothetical protein
VILTTTPEFADTWFNDRKVYLLVNESSIPFYIYKNKSQGLTYQNSELPTGYEPFAKLAKGKTYIHQPYSLRYEETSMPLRLSAGLLNNLGNKSLGQVQDTYREYLSSIDDGKSILVYALPPHKPQETQGITIPGFTSGKESPITGQATYTYLQEKLGSGGKIQPSNAGASKNYINALIIIAIAGSALTATILYIKHKRHDRTRKSL